MKTQEFINKVFELDIFPYYVYFVIDKEDLTLNESTACFDCDSGIYLEISMKQRNNSSVYTDKFDKDVPKEKIKELCNLVKQYARTPIKAR